MKTITKIDAVALATGIQALLLDMIKQKGIEPLEATYPVNEFERIIMEEKQVNKKEAERVTERVLGTGIIRWDIYNNSFIL